MGGLVYLYRPSSRAKQNKFWLFIDIGMTWSSASLHFVWEICYSHFSLICSGFSGHIQDIIFLLFRLLLQSQQDLSTGQPCLPESSWSHLVLWVFGSLSSLFLSSEVGSSVVCVQRMALLTWSVPHPWEDMWWFVHSLILLQVYLETLYIGPLILLAIQV